jgi:adenine phosphoribosyltransferase
MKKRPPSAIEQAAALLRPVPDFPKPGILFWDVQPILREPAVVKGIISAMAETWRDEQIEVIAGFDARGFLIGQALALAMDLPFEQIRKKGKLPGSVERESYALEYGEATVEMEADGFIAGKRVLLVDDLLATGGTAMAGAKLVERLDGTVAGFACITELPVLGGRGVLMHYRVESLLTIVGDTVYTDAAYCTDLCITDEFLGDLLLCERSTHPTGIAMLGGHIEEESLVAATIRECVEETGIATKEKDWSFTEIVLAKKGRDPRGMKVSLIMKAAIPIAGRRPEVDGHGKEKHQFIVVRSGIDQLPPAENFALGHGPAVHKLWGKALVSATP